MIKKSIYATVIVALSFLAGFNLHQSGLINKWEQKNAPSPFIVGMPRPYFTLIDIGGNKRDVNEWHGNVVVLNFWATWCPPCLKEVPAFVELQDQYQDSGLQFVGIALQEADEVRHYSKKAGIHYPLLVGTEGAMQVARLYGNSNTVLPYTVIIDRNGNIAFRKHGPLSKAAAEQAILPLL